MGIDFRPGDATRPQGNGVKMIVHVCNDIGAWGKGFVMAVSRRWRLPEQRYREWMESNQNHFTLGKVQFVQVEADIWVANLIGQRDIRPLGGIPPIRYDALRDGLRVVAAEAKKLSASVHMPRIGCGLAGGTWEQVGQIVEAELVAKGIPVTVYDLADKPLQ